MSIDQQTKHSERGWDGAGAIKSGFGRENIALRLCHRFHGIGGRDEVHIAIQLRVELLFGAPWHRNSIECGYLRMCIEELIHRL